MTAAVTRVALRENRRAIVARLDQRLESLARHLSVSRKNARFSDGFLAALASEMEAGGAAGELRARNPEEPYRQYLACLRHRLAAVDRSDGPARPFAGADEMAAALLRLEFALA